MCLSVPEPINEISGRKSVKMVDLELGGLTYGVRRDFVPELDIGDSCIVHARVAISRLRGAEAREALPVGEDTRNRVPNADSSEGRRAGQDDSWGAASQC